MKAIQWNEINSLAVKQMGKPAVYVSNNLEYDTPKDEEIWVFICEQCKSLWEDKTPEYHNAMMSLVSGGLFFFDTEEEQHQFYKIFTQPLTDSSAVYACTYRADGVCWNENT